MLLRLLCLVIAIAVAIVVAVDPVLTATAVMVVAIASFEPFSYKCFGFGKSWVSHCAVGTSNLA